MKAKIFVLSIASFLILLISCNKDDDAQIVPLPEATGLVKGRVMVKNGSKPVGGAVVFVLNDQSKMYYTRTDAEGNFSLKAPVGNRKLHIQTGGGNNFRTIIPVVIQKNTIQTIDTEQARLQQVASMAYVEGDYDEVQDIIADLGYVITEITNNDLKNYDTISQFDILLLNCGAKEQNDAQTDTNLADFVTNGGSLYASDYAVAYLLGGNSNSYICNEPFGFIPDNTLCARSTGFVGIIHDAEITDSALAASMGFTTLNIGYNLRLWERIYSFDPAFWDVLVNDPASNQPLMIRTNKFSGGTPGTAVGQGAADEGWVTICHNEEGVPSFTITIPEAEWPMHESHGDSMGECSNSNNSGTIYYTTFHNHAGGNIGNAGLILQYVILNL